MGAWEFTSGLLPELACSFKPTCLFCGAKLGVTKASMYHVQMSGQNDPDPQGRALDVNVRCPECGYVEVFGVAITQDEARQIHG